jgi:HMG (high mobility group) box
MAENQTDFNEIEGFTHEHVDPSQQVDEEHKQPTASKIVKKPQTAFSLYLQENKDVIREEIKGQGLAHTAFLSEASKKWNVLDANQRQKYIEIAQKQKDAYQ